MIKVVISIVEQLQSNLMLVFWYLLLFAEPGINYNKNIAELILCNQVHCFCNLFLICFQLDLSTYTSKAILEAFYL